MKIFFLLSTLFFNRSLERRSQNIREIDRHGLPRNYYILSKFANFFKNIISVSNKNKDKSSFPDNQKFIEKYPEHDNFIRNGRDNDHYEIPANTINKEKHVRQSQTNIRKKENPANKESEKLVNGDNKNLADIHIEKSKSSELTMPPFDKNYSDVAVIRINKFYIACACVIILFLLFCGCLIYCFMSVFCNQQDKDEFENLRKYKLPDIDQKILDLDYSHRRKKYFK